MDLELEKLLELNLKVKDIIFDVEDENVLKIKLTKK